MSDQSRLKNDTVAFQLDQARFSSAEVAKYASVAAATLRDWRSEQKFPGLPPADGSRGKIYSFWNICTFIGYKICCDAELPNRAAVLAAIATEGVARKFMPTMIAQLLAAGHFKALKEKHRPSSFHEPTQAQKNEMLDEELMGWTLRLAKFEGIDKYFNGLGETVEKADAILAAKMAATGLNELSRPSPITFEANIGAIVCSVVSALEVAGFNFLNIVETSDEADR